MTQSHSSGFISSSSICNSSKSDGGAGTGDDSEESSVITIGSFKSFIENHTRPFTRDYNLFATSYICDDVPYDKIICDDSDSYKDIEIKFNYPVAIQKYLIQQKCRQDFGSSVRKKFIVPSIQIIWKELEWGQRNIEDGEQRLLSLYEKARQWCEVNKALVSDHKYPKPDADVVRRKYSSAHQKAIKLVRKDMGLGKKREAIFQPGPVSTFSKTMILYFLKEMDTLKRNKLSKGKVQDDLEDMEIFIGYDAGQELNEEAKNKWKIWRNTLRLVFEEIEPLGEVEKVEKSWQLKAAEETERKRRKGMELKTIKRRFWKRNVYPPMTMEERIAEKRKLLEPFKPEGLNVDYLSGIWEPELMINEFCITPLNYDSRIDYKDGEDEPISWKEAQEATHEATIKCWKWLKSIPHNL